MIPANQEERRLTATKCAAACCVVLLASVAMAQDWKTDIPKEITTPDHVRSRLGDLDFKDGYCIVRNSLESRRVRLRPHSPSLAHPSRLARAAEGRRMLMKRYDGEGSFGRGTTIGVEYREADGSGAVLTTA